MKIDIRGVVQGVGFRPFVYNLARDNFVFMSHHIGDLENLETLTSFEEGIEHFKRIFNIEPTLIAYDLDPEYLATKYALSVQDIPKIGVQHHHAHIVSCMIDNEIDGEVIGVSFDGTGYGTDGRIWGGEFLICDYGRFERVGHLEYIPLPGGEKAVIEPMFRGIVSDLERGVGVESISSKFHNTIAKIILNMCIKIRKTSGLDRVALSGGVFQNRLLLENTYVLLNKNNFKVFTQQRVPPNDGGIALGQVVIANERIKRKNNPCLFNIIFCAFTFIICVLTLYPQPSVYAADMTLAWTENTESRSCRVLYLL